MDPDVDAVLPTSQARVEWTRLRTPLPDDLAPHAYETLRARITGPKVYDGKLIRQDDDLNADTLRHDGVVTLSTTTYFSLLLTNYMQQGVRLGSTGQWIQHPRALIDDGHGTLLGLSDSHSANPIGMSTLAFTTDHRVVVILQSSKNE